MNIDELRSELSAIEAKLAGGNYYEVLGVAESSDAAVIKRAFFGIAKKLHVDSYGGVDLGELRLRMIKAFAEVSRIHNELADPKKRSEYNAKRALTARGVSTDIRDSFASEEASRQGRRLLEQGRTESARERLQEAVRLQEGNLEARAHLLFAEYTLALSKGGAVSTGGLVHDLGQLLSQAPKMGFGHLYLGHIARNEGRTADAITAYQAALAASPGLAEAASSLRVVQMRQSKDRAEGGGGFWKKLFGR
jgi:curved DNA-binding protein CbpA